MRNAGTSVYHVSPWRRWLLWFVIGPFLLVFVLAAIFVPALDARVLLTTAGLVFLVVMPFDWIARWTRLELSPHGVRMRQFGYTLETPWTNIAEMRLRQGREGFVTKEPMTGKGAAVLSSFRGLGVGRTRFYDDEQRELLGQRRFIPIEPFAWHLRHGKLADDIARRAPEIGWPTKHTK
ncbi:MAG TPA: hypothetical protein VJ719_05590 [Chthoniobacterales bacterium]|nr:hypothetical protein [Chthoniobacterales bacterium]